jgi:hypothetical protein
MSHRFDLAANCCDKIISHPRVKASRSPANETATLFKCGAVTDNDFAFKTKNRLSAVFSGVNVA